MVPPPVGIWFPIGTNSFLGIYGYDMLQVIRHCKLAMFANGLNALKSSSNEFLDFQHDLNSLQNWFSYLTEVSTSG